MEAIVGDIAARPLTSALFCAFLLSGCAFGDRSVVLEYPPTATGNGPVQVAQAAERQLAAGPMIVVDRFDDLRTDRRIIGEVRNAYGMRTANVMVENEVTEWLAGAIVTELEGHGYRVVPPGPGVDPAIPVLDGDVLTVYCSAYLTYEGEVSFMARVEKGGEELLDRRYTGTGSIGLNWAATSDSYGRSLALALSNAVNTLVADLRSLPL